MMQKESDASSNAVTSQAPRPDLRSRLGSLAAQPRLLNIMVVATLLLGAWFRFHGLSWDANRHLHPDERFLSSVTNDLQWPKDFSQYFDPVNSTLSPYSLPNMGL